jgi:hypothetical protein
MTHWANVKQISLPLALYRGALSLEMFMDDCKGNLTDLRSLLYSGSSQGKSKVNIWISVKLIHNTYLAKENPKIKEPWLGQSKDNTLQLQYQASQYQAT